MILNVTAMYNYIDVKPFSKNDIYRIHKPIVNNASINSIYDSFYYGKVTFENSKHDVWNIETVEDFDNNINCLIIKLKTDNINNPANYKYLVIYQNITNIQNSYGFFWINKDDKMSTMHICLEYLIDELLHTIVRDIKFWPQMKLYNAISGVYSIHNIVELERLYKEYIETYRCSSYENWMKSFKKYNNRYKI